ncbi:chitinase [Specibacter cremeus]|uniref:chitinase n=1 Tax=Specibacter cremeus TaxID=1629051 RepID=UPI000F7902B2|nr:carbohydrate-binding protein [Specibacter cremeus]
MVRLGVMVLAFAVVAGAGFVAWSRFQDARAASASPSIFAGYVDVTATPTYAFESPVSDPAKSVVLSFIVADKTDRCRPSWGSAYDLPAAGQALDLDRRIARLVQQGGRVSVSFGGQVNDELATVCTDPAKLKSAYAEVVDRYDLTGIDLDIEGAALADGPSLERRAAAIAALQKDRAAAGKPLSVWLTLPVAPSGLTAEGVAAVGSMLDAGVDLTGANVMTMDFGGSRAPGQGMLQASTAAAAATHAQLAGAYQSRGRTLGDETLWRKIGLTPMIGQNDVQGEVFTLADARGLQQFAAAKGVGRMSMWSLNRDATCSPNYPDVTRVSDGCSGVEQGGALFSRVLGAGLDSAPLPGPDATATSTGTATAVVDDPATSPYPIWNETNAYVAQDRAVWRRNVYEAKWWTRGDVPDNPVLAGASTPWRLIGPVLPGDRPLPEVTVPAGTYPEWSADKVYRQGERILFDGHVFEAKWWTRTDSPEAALQGSADSPWLKLKNDAVEQLLKDKKTG